MVGAILTQNASWSNVERAIANLKRNQCLDPFALLNMPISTLHRLLMPSGFYRVKALRLRNFLKYFTQHYNGNTTLMRHRPFSRLRAELLGISGIGPETADSILLYALGKPVFVVDAYTRRICSRHGIISKGSHYEEIRQLFEQNLPRSARLYNEFHALLVRLAKTHCRTKPDCRSCPAKEGIAALWNSHH